MPWYLKQNGTWNAMGAVQLSSRNTKAGWTKVNGAWKRTYIRKVATAVTLNVITNPPATAQGANASINLSGYVRVVSEANDGVNPYISGWPTVNDINNTNTGQVLDFGLGQNSTPPGPLAIISTSTRAVVKGTITIQRSSDGGATYSNVATGITLDSTGAFTYADTVTAGAANVTYTYLAAYVPTDQDGYPCLKSVSVARTATLTTLVGTTLTISDPVNIDPVPSGSMYATQTSTFTVTLSRSDNGSPIAGANVKISRSTNGGSFIVLLSSVTTDASGSVTFTDTPISGSAGGTRAYQVAFPPSGTSAAISGITYGATTVTSKTYTVLKNQPILALTADNLSPLYGVEKTTFTLSVTFGAFNGNVFLYKSTDNGTTWTSVWSVPVSTNGPYTTAMYTYDRAVNNDTATSLWRVQIGSASDANSATSSPNLTLGYTPNQLTLNISATDPYGSSVTSGFVVNNGYCSLKIYAVDSRGNTVPTVAGYMTVKYRQFGSFVDPNTFVGSPTLIASNVSDYAAVSILSTDYNAVNVLNLDTAPQSYAVRVAITNFKGYLGTTSTPFIVYVKESLGASPAATAAYGATGSPTTLASGTSRLYQGDFGNGSGNNRSLLIFGNTTWSRVNKAKQIVSGTISFTTPSSPSPAWSTSPYSFYIDTHTYSGVAPSTFTASNGGVGGMLQSMQSNGSVYAFALTSTMLSQFNDPLTPAKGIIIGYQYTVPQTGSVVTPTGKGWVLGGTNPGLNFQFYMDPLDS